MNQNARGLTFNPIGATRPSVEPNIENARDTLQYPQPWQIRRPRTITCYGAGIGCVVGSIGGDLNQYRYDFARRRNWTSNPEQSAAEESSHESKEDNRTNAG